MVDARDGPILGAKEEGKRMETKVILAAKSVIRASACVLHSLYWNLNYE